MVSVSVSATASGAASASATPGAASAAGVATSAAACGTGGGGCAGAAHGTAPARRPRRGRRFTALGGEAVLHLHRHGAGDLLADGADLAVVLDLPDGLLEAHLEELAALLAQVAASPSPLSARRLSSATARAVMRLLRLGAGLLADHEARADGQLVGGQAHRLLGDVGADPGHLEEHAARA